MVIPGLEDILGQEKGVLRSRVELVFFLSRNAKAIKPPFFFFLGRFSDLPYFRGVFHFSSSGSNWMTQPMNRPRRRSGGLQLLPRSSLAEGSAYGTDPWHLALGGFDLSWEWRKDIRHLVHQMHQTKSIIWLVCKQFHTKFGIKFWMVSPKKHIPTICKSQLVFPLHHVVCQLQATLGRSLQSSGPREPIVASSWTEELGLLRWPVTIDPKKDQQFCCFVLFCFFLVLGWFGFVLFRFCFVLGWMFYFWLAGFTSMVTVWPSPGLPTTSTTTTVTATISSTSSLTLTTSSTVSSPLGGPKKVRFDWLTS